MSIKVTCEHCGQEILVEQRLAEGELYLCQSCWMGTGDPSEFIDWQHPSPSAVDQRLEVPDLFAAPKVTRPLSTPAPVVVGLASVLPGAGYLMLGDVRGAAFAFLAVGGLLCAAYLTREWPDAGALLLALGILAWITQITSSSRLALARRRRQQLGLPAPGSAGTPPSGMDRTYRTAYRELSRYIRPGEELVAAARATLGPSEKGGCFVGLTRSHLLVAAIGDLMGEAIDAVSFDLSEVAGVQLKRNDLLRVFLVGGRYFELSILRAHHAGPYSFARALQVHLTVDVRRRGMSISEEAV